MHAGISTTVETIWIGIRHGTLSLLWRGSWWQRRRCWRGRWHRWRWRGHMLMRSARDRLLLLSKLTTGSLCIISLISVCAVSSFPRRSHIFHFKLAINIFQYKRMPFSSGGRDVLFKDSGLMFRSDRLEIPSIRVTFFVLILKHCRHAKSRELESWITDTQRWIRLMTPETRTKMEFLRDLKSNLPYSSTSIPSISLTGSSNDLSVRAERRE